MQVLKRGEALDGSSPLLSVASFNLLAPLYGALITYYVASSPSAAVRPLDARTGQVQDFAAFAWAEPADQVAHAPPAESHRHVGCECISEMTVTKSG